MCKEYKSIFLLMFQIKSNFEIFFWFLNHGWLRASLTDILFTGSNSSNNFINPSIDGESLPGGKILKYFLRNLQFYYQKFMGMNGTRIHI